MYKTIGEVRTVLRTIDLDGKTDNQKNNHEILVNWTKNFNDDDVISPSNSRTITKRIKGIQKDLVKMSKITKSKINVLNEAIKDTLFRLYWRWQDEKEYEDWGDYVSVMKGKFETLIVEKKMSNAVYYSCIKRPFGIVFDFEGFRVTMSINSTHYSWKFKQL